MSVEIRGAEQLRVLAKALKGAGQKDLQRELSKGITDAVKPVREAVKQSAVQNLPQHGGLNRKVARSQFRTVRRSQGVKLTARNAYALEQLNRGRWRHPVYGNRSVWVSQFDVQSVGWWTKPTERVGPQARQEVLRAMDRVVRKIDRA